MSVQQMDIEKSVLSDEALSVEQKSESMKEIVDKRIHGSSSRILITHGGDLDGIGCAAVLSHKFDDIVCLPAGRGRSSYSPLKVFNLALFSFSDAKEIYITDLGQNEENREEWLSELKDSSTTIKFRDHHETSQEFINKINSIDNCEYVHNQEKCATEITLEEDYSNAPEYLREFVDYVSVRDLWLNDDPLFDETEDLAKAANWLSFDEGVAVFSENGIDIDEDDRVVEIFRKREPIWEKKMEMCIQNATIKEIEGEKIAFSFGDCDFSNTAERLKNRYNVSLSVFVSPSGYVSMRSASTLPICDRVANNFDGGGHENAAGCRPAEFDENEHVETEGEEIIERIEAEIRNLIAS